MSKRSEQRRDHKAEPKYTNNGDGNLCATCMDPIRKVYDRNNRVATRIYWRHKRRWNRRSDANHTG